MNSPLLWPFIFSLIGLSILIAGIVIRIKLQSSKSWPQTDGVILESTIQSNWDRVGSGYTYIVSPKVTYEYQVKGEKYTSSQLACLEFNSASENLAQKKSKKYSPGQQVEIYYNPQKPAFAVLEVGDPTNGKLPFGLIILGVVLIVVGAILLRVKF